MIRKTAIIIGASSDIGLSITKKFAAQGYNLALTYNTTKIDFGKELKGLNTEIKTYHLDLLKAGSIQQFFKQIKKDFKSFDTMIFCAGQAQTRTLLIDLKDEEIDQLFQLNIISATKCVKEFVKLNTNKSPANIILLGSFVEKTGCACESVYTATKSAMSSLCKSVCGEIGAMNIRINVVAPGFVSTKMNNNLSEEDKIEIAENTPLKRLGKPEDIANACFFLGSDDASFITGQTLYIDGGLIL